MVSTHVTECTGGDGHTVCLSSLSRASGPSDNINNITRVRRRIINRDDDERSTQSLSRAAAADKIGWIYLKKKKAKNERLLDFFSFIDKFNIYLST